jgi:hypothetical protein
MLSTHPAITGSTFHARIVIDLRPVLGGVYINGTHGANRHAVSAGNTFFLIDDHRLFLVYNY